MAKNLRICNSVGMKKAFLAFVVLTITLAVSATNAQAQVEHASQISIQGTGLITKETNDRTPSNEVTKTGGLLVGYSYQFSRWAGVEGNYGYTRNVHHYGFPLGVSSQQTDFHEVTGAFVAHLPVKVQHVRPYALAGGGALVFNPKTNYVIDGAQRQTRAAFVYGGGVNIDIANNFGVRAEYRGLVYKIPDFNLNSLNLDKMTHLAQPSVGFFYRF